MRLKLNESQILWMGKSRSKPEGFMIPTHLKVLTIEEKPFVYARKINPDEGEDCTEMEIPCPHFNSSNDEIGTKLKTHERN
jgi:glutamate receptor ionotropic, NMDA 1